MSQAAKDKSHAVIDSIVASFDIYFQEFEDKTDTKPVTFWIPKEYKAKYDQLQLKTQRRFSKVMIEVLKRVLERADLQIESAS